MTEITPHKGSYLAFVDAEALAEALKWTVNAILRELFQKGLIERNAGIERVSVMSTATLASADEEYAARVRGDTLKMPLAVRIRQAASVWDWPLGELPKMTERGSFVRNGAEYVMIAELRQAAGISLESTTDEDIKSHYAFEDRKLTFRPAYGVHFSISRRISPEPGPAKVSFPGSRGSFPLGLVCDALGVDTEAFQGLVEQSPTAYSDISRLARAVGLGEWIDKRALSIGEAEKQCIKEKTRETVFGTRLAAHGRAQLNRRVRVIEPSYDSRSDTLTPDDLRALLTWFEHTCKADLDLAEDDKWDLTNRQVFLVGDKMRSAFDRWGKWLRRRVIAAARDRHAPLQEADLKRILVAANRKGFGKALFSRLMVDELFDSGLCQRIIAERNNFVDAASLTQRVKFSGSDHRRRPRDFHWSHYGRLCPIDTPISDDVGTTLSLAWGARVNAGFIEVRCHRVEHSSGSVRIDPETCFLAPWEETDPDTGWVAFPDQRGALERGEEVFAHKGSERLSRVSADRVDYIHVDEIAMYGLAANLLPYRAHNDAVRGVMACSFLRQALPLKDGRPPRVETGFERSLPAELPYSEGSKVDGQLAFGADLLVGYLPWKGWNFEDAVVVSSSAAQTLTSLHDRHVRVRLPRSLAEHYDLFQRRKAEVTVPEGVDHNDYDERGVIKKGCTITAGQPLVIGPETLRHEPSTPGDCVVHTIEVLEGDDQKRGTALRFTLRAERSARVGDKLANRHGHKGVISRVMPDAEMPYVLTGGADGDGCACGEEHSHRHLQLLLNPLGVISRMNLGQLFETLEARDDTLKPLAQRLPCYDPALPAKDRKLDRDVFVGHQYVLKLDHNAAEKLHGRSRVPWSYSTFTQQPLQGRRLDGGQRFGEMETWALMAHRSPRLLQEMMTLKSDNPKERALLFASLLGGVEFTPSPNLPEALRAFAAFCYALGLQLEVRSADDKTLDLLSAELAPEMIAGLRLSLLDQSRFLQSVSNGEVKSPQRRSLGEMAVDIEASDEDVSGGPDAETGSVSKDRVAQQPSEGGVDGDEDKRASIPSKKKKRYEYEQDGLDSEKIFGPVKSFSCACGRYKWATRRSGRPTACEICGVPLLPQEMRRRRMGHIALACPVPNPYLTQTGVLLDDETLGAWQWLDLGSLIEDRARLRFRPTGKDWDGKPLEDRLQEGWRRVHEFCSVALRCSPSFKSGLERRIDVAFAEGLPTEGDPDFEIDMALRRLLQEALLETEQFSVYEFVEQAITQFGYTLKGLDQVNGLFVEVLEEEGICGIDFLVDLLTASPRYGALCLSILPVLPPDLRRRFRQRRVNVVHDLTALYQQVLLVNRRLEEAIEALDQGAEGAEVRYRKRRVALQRAVTQLMCNQLLPPRQRAREFHQVGQPVCHSLSSFLENRTGLLVGHLLGKRVDYSGRAVIVPDPTLNVDRCRLSLTLAVRLFMPQLRAVLRETVQGGDPTLVIERALRGEERAVERVSKGLRQIVGAEQVTARHDLAGTLQAAMMRGGGTADHKLVLLNRQPTLHRLSMLSFEVDLIDEAVIAIPPLVTRGYNADFDGDQMAVYLPITPLAVREMPRMKPSAHLWHPADGRLTLSMEQDIALGGYIKTGESKKRLIDKFERRVGESGLRQEIETNAKAWFDAATRSGLSFGIGDLQALQGAFAEKYSAPETPSGDEWQAPLDEVQQTIQNAYRDEGEPFRLMLDSGARGDWKTMNYLIGQSFKDRPNSNLTAGLAVGERLLNAVEGRRNLVDVKLGTAEAGSLTKLLVSMVAGITISTDDCGTIQGLTVDPFEWSPVDEGRHRELLDDDVFLLRLYGRVLARDFREWPAGTRIDAELALSLTQEIKRLAKESSDPEGDAGERRPYELRIRSPITCEADDGICRTCYGLPLSSGRYRKGWSEEDRVLVGEPVGVIAAQAVGEPATQMALRKKHVTTGHVSDEPDDEVSPIKRVRQILRGINELPEPELLRQLEYVYRKGGITFATIHLETILAGKLPGSEGNSDWLNDTAADATVGRRMNRDIARAALFSAEDSLRGPRERLVIGSVVKGGQD